jgi:maltokinase
VIDQEALAARLPAYLPAQRWFGAKDQRVREVVSVTQEVLRPSWPALVWVAATVRLDEAGEQTYQLLLGARPPGTDVEGRQPLGQLPTALGAALVFDALLDPELTLAVLPLVADGMSADRARPLGVEQSNTSVVYDDRAVLKLFRRFEGGPNADAEVATSLRATGFDGVPAVLARWQVDGSDRAVVQEYLPDAADGWTLALASLRTLLAGDGATLTEAAGDVGPEMARLGAVTGDLHVALASAFGRRPGKVGDWEAAIGRQFERVHHAGLDRDRAWAMVVRLDDLSDPGMSIRVHGDYHLGQVLRTDSGWQVLDFEGEPARPADDRALWSSPLRDVAGMVRSIQYAALSAEHERGAAPLPAARAWEQRNRDAFLAAYRARVAHQELVPADARDFATLLAAFELEKAVYEVGYEAAHRPDWIGIPLDGVRRLLEAA